MSIMRRSVIIITACVAQTLTDAKDLRGRTRSIDKLVEELIDSCCINLLNRALKSSHLQWAHLDQATLGTPHYLKIPSRKNLRGILPHPAFSLAAQAHVPNRGRHMRFHGHSLAHPVSFLQSSDEQRTRSRRDLLVAFFGGLAVLLPQHALAEVTFKDEDELPGTYEDWARKWQFSGEKRGKLLFRDAKPGDSADKADIGDMCVIDWNAYILDTRGKQLTEVDGCSNGQFDFQFGKGEVLATIEEGVLGMRKGGVRQLVVKLAELGKLDASSPMVLKDSTASTPSGQCRFSSILDNQDLKDKTLLLNLKLTQLTKSGQKA